MNLGTILQYARDFHHCEPAGKAIEFLLDWLDTHWVNPDTGIWGTLDISDPINRSQAVQAAYHWWPLYFYDERPVPYIERAIDTLLATQNPSGGLGWGVHNSGEPFKSSACEDIDSIDPLVRMSFETNYRRDDIHKTLERALPWLLKNQMQDGGFVFYLDKPFQYGHPELHGEKNKGAMFPTWFRTLTIALLGKALKDSFVGEYKWNFVGCPGFHFWSENGIGGL